jgi:hypothetical protein
MPEGSPTIPIDYVNEVVPGIVTLRDDRSDNIDIIAGCSLMKRCFIILVPREEGCMSEDIS